MKTGKIFAALIILMTSMQLKAQQTVSGTVILRDTNQVNLPDMSGTMVIFSSQGISSSDTTYTDVNGYFIDTLQPGTYNIYQYKIGFDTLDHISNVFVSTIPVAIPTDTLDQVDSEILLGDTVRGTLIAFKHYYFKPGLTFTVTINAGDTLIVPQGCWLRSVTFTVNGCLILQGTEAHPVVWFFAGNTSGRYFVGIQNDGYSTVTGSLFANHVLLPGIFLLGSNMNFTNVNNNAKIFYAQSPLLKPGGVTTYDSYIPCSLECGDGQQINITESALNMTLTAGDFANVNLSCNDFVGTETVITISSGSNIDYENNYAGTVTLQSAGNAIFRNNYFEAAQIEINQPSTSPVANVEFTNNSFATDEFAGSILIDSGNCNLKLVNNLGIRISSFSNTVKNALISSCEYNLLTPSGGSSPGLFFPIGVTLPSDVANPYVPPGTTKIDTVDSSHNRFDNSFHIYGPDGDSFPNYSAGADTLFLHKGNPALKNADSSVSNIGAFREILSCINPAIPIPHAFDTTTVVAGIDSIYPGDANYDGICNNLDVLPIGLRYNETGPVRTGASLAWIGQYATAWADSLTNPSLNYVNDKHIDCNGDGVINYHDIDAIYKNYSLTHTIVHKTSSYGSGLWLQFPSDSIFAGDTVVAKVMLGTNLQPVDSVYGLAFSINYDAAFVSQTGASMTFATSWMGTDSVNMISFFKSIPDQSRYDVAISRTDKQAISGSGQIASLIIVINDDIAGKDSILTTAMNFSSIYAIDEHEREQNIGSNDASFNVTKGTRYTGVQQMVFDAASLSIYPNPASDNLVITTQVGVQGKATLFSAEGQAILQANLKNENEVLNISSLPDGLYILKVDLQGKTICRKVVIAR